LRDNLPVKRVGMMNRKFEQTPRVIRREREDAYVQIRQTDQDIFFPQIQLAGCALNRCLGNGDSAD
jgi:hypothetical protein